ncbi:MAG: hypothetical protein JKY92_06395 [Magnetovibrio sp.]|nr:hypothetical protein [Magnetovibrio sp.]
MVADFWLGVAQTTIGSAVGFVFGIFAFHHQQLRQSAKKEKDDWRAALDALNRLTTAAGANIEALVNSKLQLINDLRPEVEKMKAASEDAYKTPRAERAKKITNLIAQSEAMLHFYMSLPETSVMAPPEFGEYSSLSKEMPALTMFVHRAMGMMQELNEQIRSRNALIAQQAQESGTGDGLTAERVIYYSSMLSGQGEAICQNTNFALDFWRLVLDQIKAYMTAKAKGEHFFEYTLVPEAVKAMPKEELFPLMRQQLATFAG